MNKDYKERPLLMRGEMVRAILADEKTETRRLKGLEVINAHGNDWQLFYFGELETKSSKPRSKPKQWYGADFINKLDNSNFLHTWIPSPYGKPGDRIWIKETWRPANWSEASPMGIEYRADGQVQNDRSDEFDPFGLNYPEWHEDQWIKCTDECLEAGVPTDEDGDFTWDDGKSPIKWRPSIFMPRWCSRIDLEIIEIRIERLHDITIDGVYHEGYPHKLHEGPIDPFSWYMKLWDEINFKKAPASSNPFVWTIKFKRTR